MLMRWVALGLGLAALAFILWVWFNSRRYAKILRAAHYVEVAQGAQRLKAAALAHIETAGQVPTLDTHDPRVLTTSANLVIAYSIRHSTAPDATAWTHHLAVKMATGFTPHRVAAPVIVFLLRLLGIGLPQAVAQISPTRVFDVEWTLDEDEQAAFVAREIVVPSLEQARRLHLECLRRRDELRLGE